MKTITVKLGKRSYKLIIGFGVIKKLGSQIRRLNIGNDAYLITNPQIKKRYGRVILDSLNKYNINVTSNTIFDSEKSKSLSRANNLIESLARFDQKKKVFIIAFGGGVIGDLSGFVASIYKRGIPYIQIPTTLLACVDSSIGGKTGVDLRIGKNLVGTFYQPRLVMSELAFLKTLNGRQVRSGLAEVIKYAIIRDKLLFKYLENNYPRILNLNEEALEFIVTRCAEIKVRIIEKDEREEKGLRTILNFGHTLGHAIEAAGAYQRYNHGEAIAIGMILAVEISKRLGLIKQDILKRIEDLFGVVGLPTNIKGLSEDTILQAYYHDKKFIGGINRFVLIKDIGRTVIKQDLDLHIIKAALRGRMSL